MAKTKIRQNHLLTPEERAVCGGLASGETPHSQRAMALLALDEGATQMQAAGQAGLTKGQVRYWLAKFRQERLAIFPEALLADPQPKLAPELPTAEVPEPPTPSQEVGPPSQPIDQTPTLLEAETGEKAEPAKGTKKAKKVKKGEKGPKKKAKKSKPDKDSQKKSKPSKKKKAKKKDEQKAKKEKTDKKAGDKKN